MNIGARVGLWTAGIFGAAGVTAYLRRPRPVTLRAVLPPRPAPLEDWEEEAEFGGAVEPGWRDEIVDPIPEGVVVIGSGSPEDLCGPLGNPVPDEACVLDPLGDERFAPVEGARPLAEPGTTGAIWPLRTRHRRRLVTSYWTKPGLRGAWGRHFAAKRHTEEGEVRRHAGVDLFGDPGDVVVAPEAGRIVGILPFHHGTWAIYLRIPGGRVVNLGEVDKYSWRDFDIHPVAQVEKGQPLARVGRMSGGSSMLHFEIYDAADIMDDDLLWEIRRGEMSWPEGHPPPRLLDPSAYLVDAAARTHRSEQRAEAA